MIFLVILVLCIVITNFIYVKLIFEKKQIYRTEVIYQDYIKSLPSKELDFAFFGDSHAGRGINPEFLPNTFNFGLIGERYLGTYYKLKKILEYDKVKINNIIFEVDLHSFSESYKTLTLSQNELHFYTKNLDYDDFKETTGESRLATWLKSHMLFLGKGDELRLIVKKPKLTDMYLGWTKLEGNFSRSKTPYEDAEQAALFHFKGKSLLNEDSFKYFIKTIKLAKENNITIFFIKYPLSEEYLSIVEKEHNISTQNFYDDIFTEIDIVLDKNYTILDYQTFLSNQTKYFEDPHHLNYVGAEIFSKKVYKDLSNSGFAQYVFDDFHNSL